MWCPPEISGALILASAFTRPVYRALSQASPVAGPSLRALSEVAASRTNHDATLGEAFDEALRQLAVNYRSEYFYKAQIVSKVVFGRHSPRTAAALLELPMGSAIADVVIINGTSTIYEVKTDLDNFDRLPAQLHEYGTRAEFVNVVVSETRAARAIEVTPSWVGVVALRRNGALSVCREPSSRLEHISAEHQFHMLRTEEARRAVAACTGELIEAPTGRAWPLLRDAFSRLSPAQANTAVVRELRLRGRHVADLTDGATFPASLRAMAYAQPLSGAAQRRLLHHLHSPAAALA